MCKPNEFFLAEKLVERTEKNALRQLTLASNHLIDFSSNDYLGFAKSKIISENTQHALQHFPVQNGSTGSRLLSGNTPFAQDLEHQLAHFHQAEAGLLFNSGYDANLGLMSCIAQKSDTYLSDELIHASLIDGMRLSYAHRFKFKHNNLKDLTQKLQNASGQKFVIVESIYSMDGDAAPLVEILEICQQYGAHLIVDEAHAVGVFGEKGVGICQQLNIHQHLFARIITFGKAIGGHGAIVLGSQTLKNYLINFSRSFIYTTAAPVHSLVHIQKAYEQLENNTHNQEKLHENISFFKQEIQQTAYQIIDSRSAIQSIIIGGNETTRQLAQYLQEHNFDVKAILAPTVPPGSERLRICLHSFNSKAEIQSLIHTLKQYQ